MSTTAARPLRAHAALLAGALVWGVIWYPYRLLNEAGIGGLVSSIITYAIAFALGLVPLVWRGTWRKLASSWWLAAIALAAGGCNIGYVLATLDGVVMRVLLLFYLSPLWTVLLARLILSERLGSAGAALIALSLTGAAVMLWSPALGMPWPENHAEWIGLASGFLFALANVLIRRTPHLPIEVKCLAVFLGVAAIGVVLMVAGGFEWSSMPRPNVHAMMLLALIGMVLLVINFVVQYGLTHTPANQAIVIFLFELVVAAVSSWLLAGEQLGPREWLGGAMIVAASLFSGRVGEDATPHEAAAPA